MKQSLAVIAAACLCATALIPASAQECARYADSANGFSVCAPAGWKSAERIVDGRRYAIWSKDRAEVAVCGLAIDTDAEGAWDQAGVWSSLVGVRPVRIAATDERRIGGLTFRILISECSSRLGRMMQRAMIARYGNILVAVECRAPVPLFAKYRDTFDMVMGSLEFSGLRKRLAEEERARREQEEMEKQARIEEEERSIIQDELKKIEDLERRGILERLREQGEKRKEKKNRLRRNESSHQRLHPNPISSPTACRV